MILTNYSTPCIQRVLQWKTPYSLEVVSHGNNGGHHWFNPGCQCTNVSQFKLTIDKICNLATGCFSKRISSLQVQKPFDTIQFIKIHDFIN